MNKLFPSLLAILIGIGISLNASANAYIRGATAPWGEVTNEAAMDVIFGAGNWDDLRMADGAGPFVPGVHDFIFLEGGDDTANELAAFLTANQAAIEAYVTAGGRLLLNSAPNEGGDIAYGFGGVTLVYPASTDAVTAADAGHPVFGGPCDFVGTDYTGDSFGHAVVGGEVSPIIIGDIGDENEGETVLGEMDFGSGLVLFGGMTTNNYHDPEDQAANLRSNIIAYTAGLTIASGCEAPPAPIPSLNKWGLLVLVSLMMLAGFGARRRFS